MKQFLFTNIQKSHTNKSSTPSTALHQSYPITIKIKTTSTTPIGQLFKETTDPPLLPFPPPLLEPVSFKHNRCFPRKVLVQTYSICTGVGRFAPNKFKMGFVDSNVGECGLIKFAKTVVQDCYIL